jgi:SAM-dependent methyltransferase
MTWPGYRPSRSSPAQAAPPAIRGSRFARHNTEGVSTAPTLHYGPSVADDAELRLTGDLTGKRTIELGVSAPSNAVAMALRNARALAVDPSPDRIALVRKQAEEAEVTVQCHESEIADLGFVTSASIDLVVASHVLHAVDDLPRLLRQVHRVLRPETSFILSEPHPFSEILVKDGTRLVVDRPYSETRTIGDVVMAMQRANFAIDVVHELSSRAQRHPLVPAVLVVKARKLGV